MTQSILIGDSVISLFNKYNVDNKISILIV